MRLYLRRALVLFCLLTLLALPAVAADMGFVPPGGVSVYEPGQKAIVAWNGEREVLILSVDIQASENSWALELLPLPSRPDDPENGSFDSFLKVQDLLNAYMFNVYTEKEGSVPLDAENFEVVFQENIGAHSIVIVRASSASQLVDFSENLLENKGLTQEVSWENLENLVAGYLERDINYWVLDLIDLSDYLKSREPIIYTFESDYLYFPLEISSLASGETEITLFTLTEDSLDAGEIENAGFSIASFAAGGENVLVEIEVDENDLNQISPKVAELFEGGARLTTLTYEGPLGDLKRDLILSHAAAVEEIPTEVAIFTVVSLGVTVVALGIGGFLRYARGRREKRVILCCVVAVAVTITAAYLLLLA